MDVTRLASTLFLLALALGSSGSASAGPDAGGAGEAALQRVLVGLAARDGRRRLAALGELGRLIEVDPKAGTRALPRLRAILRLRGAVERAQVVPLLVRIPSPDARDLWLRHLDPAVEPHEAVWTAAAAATGEVPRDVDLAKRLLRVAGGSTAGARPGQRALALEALASMESPAVPLLLARGRPGETWVEACARARALGRRRTPRSIPGLLALLAHESLAVRVHAWEGLVQLTGRDLPVAPAPWSAWWAEQDPTKLPARPQPKVAGPRYAAAKPRHVPHYYGIPIPRPRSRVVFCLDASQSMYGSGIDDARRELKRALMDLPSTHAFEIVVFNERVLPWARRLVRAHPVQKHLAIRHLDTVEPTSYTNLYDAVETAFSHAGRGRHPVADPAALQAVFLLSDGAPNRGRFRTHERVVKHVGRLSRREIPVHTIGAGEEVFPLLRAIAHETGGTFVDAFE